jgi:hypothetical protein
MITMALYTQLTSDDLPNSAVGPPLGRRRSLESAWFPGVFKRLRGRDSNPDYLIQSQASYH